MMFNQSLTQEASILIMADLKKNKFRYDCHHYMLLSHHGQKMILDRGQSTNRILITECVKQRKKDGKYVSETIDEPFEIDIE